LDDVAKQSNLRMTTVIDHPLDAESLIMAPNECFTQLTQQTSMSGAAIAESET
jgi:hypothetical protein